VSYKTLDGTEEVATRVVIGALGLLAAKETDEYLLKLESRPSLSHVPVVVFVGSQLDTSDLRKGQASKLGPILESATSSLVFPYTSGKGELVENKLAHVLKSAQVKYQTIGCDGAVADYANEAAAAFGKGEKPRVLIVCSTVPATENHTPAGLQMELDQLAAVQEAVEASDIDHLFLYTSRAMKSRRQRRQLQTTPKRSVYGSYTCGELCQVQVRWLEGILAAVILALASCAGLTCLKVLNTPTRYEALKEGQSS